MITEQEFETLKPEWKYIINYESSPRQKERILIDDNLESLTFKLRFNDIFNELSHLISELSNSKTISYKTKAEIIFPIKQTLSEYSDSLDNDY